MRKKLPRKVRNEIWREVANLPVNIMAMGYLKTDWIKFSPKQKRIRIEYWRRKQFEILADHYRK